MITILSQAKEHRNKNSEFLVIMRLPILIGYFHTLRNIMSF